MTNYAPELWLLDESALPLVEDDETPTVPAPRAPEPPTVTQVNGREVTVRRCLLARPGEAPAVTVSVTVPLTVEDVVAVLVAHNVTYAELADDDTIRQTVAGAVLNNGCLTLEEWRSGPGPGFVDDAGTGAYVEHCRARVAEVFAGAVSGDA